MVTVARPRHRSPNSEQQQQAEFARKRAQLRRRHRIITAIGASLFALAVVLTATVLCIAYRTIVPPAPSATKIILPAVGDGKFKPSP